MNATAERHQLCEEDFERWEFCKRLQAGMLKKNNQLPMLDHYCVMFVIGFISDPRPLLNVQREAIDQVRTACEGKL